MSRFCRLSGRGELDPAVQRARAVRRHDDHAHAVEPVHLSQQLNPQALQLAVAARR